MLACQPMAIPPKRISLNHLSEESWPGVSSLRISLQTLTLSGRGANAGSPAWDSIISTARIGNLLPYLILFPGR